MSNTRSIVEEIHQLDLSDCEILRTELNTRMNYLSEQFKNKLYPGQIVLFENDGRLRKFYIRSIGPKNVKGSIMTDDKTYSSTMWTVHPSFIRLIANKPKVVNMHTLLASQRALNS